MAKKEFKYQGKTIEELKQIDNSEFMKMTTSSARRAMKRGGRESAKTFMKNVEKGQKNIKTHNREIIIIPKMVGMQIKVHTGKTFEAIDIQPEMIGHRLGEFALTRKRITHTSPGVGATKGSSNTGKK